MSLQVWLPLDGNLNDNGLAGATITTSGTVEYSSGLYNHAKTSGIVNIDKNYQEKIGTVAFWLFTTPTTAPSTICGNNGTTAIPGNRKWSLYRFSTRNDLHSWGCMKDTSTTYNSPFTITGVLKDNEWTHVCMAHDLSNIYVYINGELKLTKAWDSSGEFSFDTGYPISAQNNGSKICDFRLYDHCLSAAEVKEISKGLLLHYKLTDTTLDTSTTGDITIEYDCSGYCYNGKRNNLSYTNYIAKGMTLNKSSNTTVTWDPIEEQYTIVSPVGTSTWGYGFIIPQNIVSVPYNKYYRITFDVFVPTNHKIQVDINNTVASGTAWNGNDNDSDRNATGWNITGGKWTRISYGARNANTKNTEQIDIKPYDSIGLVTTNDTSPVTWFIKNLKLEVLDSIDTTIYPTNGLVTWNTSPRYSNATKFPTGSYIGINNLPLNDDSRIFTFSAWIRSTNSTATQCIYNGRTTVGGPISIFLASGKVRFDDGSQHPNLFTYPVNEWFHLCITRDETNIKVYNNGVLVKQETSTDFTGIGTKGTIGASSVNTSTGSVNNFIGDMVDFRIYGTALSDDDVMDLYNTGAMIDKSGNVYCFEFDERMI